MPMPVLDSFGQEVYDRLLTLTRDDEIHGWSLALYVNAIGKMFQIVEDYSRDQIVGGQDLPGWSQLLDVDRAPTAALGWLAQFVGVELEPNLDDATQRARIRETAGWKRGSLGAISGAAHQYLIAPKNVIIRERDPVACPTHPAYGLTVITYTSQTPDSAKVLAALLAQKPAGIILRYITADGQDYQALIDDHPLYSGVFSTYTTYEGVATDTPGT